MRSTFKHYSQIQRYQIYALKKARHNQIEVAANIGVHKSTVSRELPRNKGLNGYRPKQANHLAVVRQQGKTLPWIRRAHWLKIE